MKKIILARDMMDKENDLSCSERESAVVVEVEDEVFCEGCSNNVFIDNYDIVQDFIWHPKKKY